jgi:hypothetical protein
MNQKCAIIKSLLKGEVLSIMNGFKWFGCTNIPREIGRSIEREFGVTVSRVRKEGKSRYKQPVSYFQYRLNRTDHNLEGIAKMEEYVKRIEGEAFNPPVKRGAKTIHVKEYNDIPEDNSDSENIFLLRCLNTQIFFFNHNLFRWWAFTFASAL